MQTHAEVLAQTLARLGVEYIFGLPGGEIVAFMDACRRAGMRFVLAGHEASAAWMAQTVGQMTGIPGVCAATLGPGATNFVSGVANAFLDRAPLLAVTAQVPRAKYDTLTHQRLPLAELFRPITKGTVLVGETDTEDVARSGMQLAAAPRPGPVHLALPSDIAVQECAASGASKLRANDSVASPDISEVAARIAAANRPLVLVGLGAGPECAPSLRSFVHDLDAPFVVTPKVKGILPEDDPLFLGVASGMAIDDTIVETLRSADLIIAVGFDPVESTKTWFAEVPLVAIDSASMREGNYQPLEVIGDIPAVLDRLRAGLAAKPWPEDLLQLRRKVIERAPSEAGRGLSPLRALEELRAAFPRDAIATCDVGSHKLMMGQFWKSYEPGTFFLSNGLSCMGYGLPGAIAAQLVHRDRVVLAVVGDGGMLMMLHDLLLIRDLGLPIVVVVFVDGSLSLIRISEERRSLAPLGVDFAPPDFVQAASAFGVYARRANTTAEIREAVDQALSSRTALLLEVPIDYREYYALV